MLTLPKAETGLAEQKNIFGICPVQHEGVRFNVNSHLNDRDKNILRTC